MSLIGFSEGKIMAINTDTVSKAQHKQNTIKKRHEIIIYREYSRRNVAIKNAY